MFKNIKNLFWPVFLLILITFLAFSPALMNSFISLDDEAMLVKNSDVQNLSWANVQKIFRTF